MSKLVAILLLSLAVLCPGAAWAHAALAQAEPADGDVLASAPDVVHLRFNEPVSVLAVRLFDATGRAHADLVTDRHGEALAVRLPAGLGPGSHVLSYRVVSSDGHPVGGSLAFSVGARSGAATAAHSTAEDGVRVALWLARLVLHMGLFVGAGGVFFLAWVAPEPVGRGRAPRPFIMAGLLALGLSVGLQGVDALGATMPELSDPRVWAAGADTAFGGTAAAGLAALVLAWLAMRAGGPSLHRALAAASLLAAGAAPALSGHAGSAGPQWLTRTAVFLHGVGVAYWVGALIPLVFVIVRVPERALPTARRFSAGAIGAVAVLAATGLLLAAIQVEDPANLLTTAYGRVLTAKLLLVGMLLGFAAVNRLWLTPALARTNRFAAKWLLRSVAAEIALAMAILGVVGLWRFTPPPRALASAARASATASVHLHTPRVMAQVSLLPGQVGATRATVVVASGQPDTGDPKEVTLVLAKPDAGVEPVERRARKGARVWEVDGLVLPVPGPWQVKVEILVSDFEKVVLEGSVVVRPGTAP